MNRSRILLLMLLLPSLLICGQQGAGSMKPAKHGGEPALCNVDSLPVDVRLRLKEEFVSWKVQEPIDLSARARERWESEKPLECPGIAVGHFESVTTPTYAVLLVPIGHSNAGYRFLVFSQKGVQATYETQVVEKSEESLAANYFIHRTAINKFFDETSRRKFQASTADGILLIDSAENEYGVEVYFWSGGRYRHEPIDY